MKKLLLIGAFGLLMGSMQPAQAMIQPETKAAAAVAGGLALLGILTEGIAYCGVDSALSGSAALLAGGSTYYMMSNLLPTALAKASLFSFITSNPGTWALGTGIGVGTGLAAYLKVLKNIKPSPAFKEWTRWLLLFGAAFGAGAAFSYLLNMSGQQFRCPWGPVPPTK